MKTPAFYVCKNSRLIWKEKNARYTYEFFSLERPHEYVYSYAYEKHELWGTYIEDLSCTEPTTDAVTFTHEGYIILDIVPIAAHANATDKSAADGATVANTLTEEKLHLFYELISPQFESDFLKAREHEYLLHEDVQKEIAKTVTKIKHIQTRVKNGGAAPLTFTLLADTHYVANGNWETCAATVEAVNAQTYVDAVIHLGDLTDGMLTKHICREYSGKVLNRMRSWNKPLYFTIGNHDTNYFGNNPERYSEEEQYNEYITPIIQAEQNGATDKVDSIHDDSLCGKNESAKRNGSATDSAMCEQNTKTGEKSLWYEKRFPEQQLTCFFLSSFDSCEKIRYGFPSEEIEWLKELFLQLPSDERIIIFSHEAPLSRLDYWASEVRGEKQLTEFLDSWQHEHESPILAFIHGHTHSDYVDRTHPFPIISVGCGKIEYFEGKSPEGAVKPMREWHTVTQELWDTVIIDTNAKTLDFVRFGAGIDRSVAVSQCGESVSKFDNTTTGATDTNAPQALQKVPFNKPQIWAHRGASAYAPENTLASFKKAIEMHADGVELDVQLTKDGQLVVIHDERIDRVSNGSGFVADFTLPELRAFNFNKTYPQCAHADIPTLKEVLALLQPTELTVNIELKTGINFYPGIEEKTVRLVREMNMSDRVIYSAFNHESVRKVLKIDPTAKTGFLYCDGTLDMVQYAKNHGAQALHPATYLVKIPGFVEACKESAIKLHVWTANDRDAIGKLVQLGIDAIITNYPDVAYEVVCGKEAEPCQVQTVTDTSAQTHKKQTITRRLLHIVGFLYAKVRKVFVLIDKKVQKLARDV